MATVSELWKELRSLPKGNVYEKTIAGKTYFYHHYFEAGKRYAHIVPAEEVPALWEKIARRKQIKRELSKRAGKDVVLSPAAASLTGSVMNGDRVVARFEQGRLVDIDEKLAPLSIVKTRSMERFLRLRVLDMSRTNARILRRVLGINVDEDYKTALYSYALSVYDRYWFKPKHSKLTYDQLALRDDLLFDTALKGEVNEFYGKAKLSPELTTSGSFEKGWRNIDGVWWLYKSGNPAQIFSELFCSSFAHLMGIPTVDYEYDEGYIRCRNFSQDTNFEPIAALADGNEDYSYLFGLMLSLGEDIAKQYLVLSAFDSVVYNVDRHNENLGLLRDVSSGAILSLAPNFDNNLALVATNERLNDNPAKDGFIALFVKFLAKEPRAKALYKQIQFPEIALDEIQRIVDSIPLDIPYKETIAPAVLARYQYLKSLA